MAEALTLHESLIWLTAHCTDLVDVELDSKGVVDVVMSQYDDFLEFDQLIHDCSSLLRQRSNWILSWIRRQANMIAHMFPLVDFYILSF